MLFQKTRFGLAMRGVASNTDSARLVGIPTGRILAGSWAIAGALGALAAVLVAGNQGQVTPNLMVTVFTYATAAAVLGGLDSPGGAVIGGLLIGIGEAVAAEFAPGVDRSGHEAGRRPGGHLRGVAVQAVGLVRHGESGASVIKINEGSVGHWVIRLVWVAAVVAVVLYIPTKTDVEHDRRHHAGVRVRDRRDVAQPGARLHRDHLDRPLGVLRHRACTRRRSSSTRYGWSQGWTFYVAAAIAFVVGCPGRPAGAAVEGDLPRRRHAGLGRAVPDARQVGQARVAHRGSGRASTA